MSTIFRSSNHCISCYICTALEQLTDIHANVNAQIKVPQSRWLCGKLYGTEWHKVWRTFAALPLFYVQKVADRHLWYLVKRNLHKLNLSATYTNVESDKRKGISLLKFQLAILQTPGSCDQHIFIQNTYQDF